MLRGGHGTGLARNGANCFSGILTTGGGRHVYESQAKGKVSTQAERGVKTYRVKSAATKKPAQAKAIRERFVKH